MPILDSIKDENGQIKKPILYSAIGGVGLVGYLLLRGGGSQASTSSTGQTTPLTPDLTALQDALKNANFGGSNGAPGAPGATGATGKQGAPGTNGTGSTPKPPPIPLPVIGGRKRPPVIPGSSGTAGGGGGGTGTVIHPTAKDPGVYAGLTEVSKPLPPEGIDAYRRRAADAAKAGVKTIGGPVGHGGATTGVKVTPKPVLPGHEAGPKTTITKSTNTVKVTPKPVIQGHEAGPPAPTQKTSSTISKSTQTTFKTKSGSYQS